MTVSQFIRNRTSSTGDTPKNQCTGDVIAMPWHRHSGSGIDQKRAYRNVTIPTYVFEFTVNRHRNGPDDNNTK